MRFRAVFLAFALIACSRESSESVKTTTAATGTGTLTGAPENVAAKKVDTTITPVAGTVLQQCRVGADALVTTEKTAFAKGEPIFFAMWLKEAPERLQVSVKVLEGDENEVTTIRQAGEDKNVVSFKIDPAPKAGRYSLEGYWGGNLVCEKTITVK